MELVIHYIYTVAISKCNPTWTIYSPFQLSMLGYFHLHHIWLKLLLPWRFFRLWALIDGIDPPENMVRCMSNNYSALAFWRGWHRSFNRWIVRYIYIPLGGSGSPTRPNPSPIQSQSNFSKSPPPPQPKRSSILSKIRPIVNLLIVFTFVALWHDINATLLYWSWLITLFILPEALLTFGFPARNFTTRPTLYRVLCGVGAVFNILMMMAANLVGFAVGLDGLQQLVGGIVGSWWGLGFLGIACGALFVGVQVMFEIREDEARQGIRMKC
jgi:protein-cysteine N-palmitoyltransferase HHAT